jgi:selenocysteine-specific elongation factor
VNLQGLEVADLSRGDVVTRPGAIDPTRTADVRVQWLGSAASVLGTASVEFLTGTSERRARLAPIGVDGFVAGEACFSRLHIDGDAVAMLPGDRFIVRGFARSEQAGATLGGGVILDVAPPHRRRSDPALLRELEIFAKGEEAEWLLERVRRTGFAGALAGPLTQQLGHDRPSLDAKLQALADTGVVLLAGAHRWIDRRAVDRMQSQLVEALAAFHLAEPMRPGMPRASLRGCLPSNVASEVSELALTRLEAANEIDREGDVVRLADHRPTLDPEAEAATRRIVAEADEAGLEPPNPREWADRLGVSLDRFRDLVAHLQRENQLVRAPGDLWFARPAIDELCERVRAHLEANGELDTQTYKSLIGTSRRTAMPLMELLDELHLTRRRGEVRVLRPGS